MATPALVKFEVQTQTPWTDLLKPVHSALLFCIIYANINRFVFDRKPGKVFHLKQDIDDGFQSPRVEKGVSSACISQSKHMLR